MLNCLVMGCGRSGTSMLAGSLSKAGYFMGKNLLPPNRNNPKGYFETREVESLNEELIATVVPARPKFWGRWFFRDRPLSTQRWLATVPVETTVNCSPTFASKIQDAVARQPYCYKDPRFCYTLPAWRPYLKNIGFVCIFREPATTVKSIMHVMSDEDYLQSLSFSKDRAFEVWTLMYRHILENHQNDGKWLFLHYNQLFEVSGRQKLEAFLHVSVDDSFPERRLSRSSSDEGAPETATRVYEQLCELAQCDRSGNPLRLVYSAHA
ncbi:MAG TPA: sulfotransferase [Bryobacteraceae bacterium]|nr:sulfotransferase [Bryobacteraceae bacterium]